MNLETLALVRAQEQLDAGSWRRADKGEALVIVMPACVVCGRDARRIAGRPPSVPLCAACRAKGWRSQVCPGCNEHPLHKRDYSAGIKGLCGPCRASIRAQRELR